MLPWLDAAGCTSKNIISIKIATAIILLSTYAIFPLRDSTDKPKNIISTGQIVLSTISTFTPFRNPVFCNKYNTPKKIIASPIKNLKDPLSFR